VDYDLNHKMDQSQRILFKETLLTRVYLRMLGWFMPIFNWLGWSVLQVVVLAWSLATLVRNRLRHDGAFILLILALTALGNGMVVSLVEYSQPRYSYPFEWIYYVTALSLPLLVPARRILPQRPGILVGE
jgi:hypothetical protein